MIQLFVELGGDSLIQYLSPQQQVGGGYFPMWLKARPFQSNIIYYSAQLNNLIFGVIQLCSTCRKSCLSDGLHVLRHRHHVRGFNVPSQTNFP